MECGVHLSGLLVDCLHSSVCLLCFLHMLHQVVNHPLAEALGHRIGIDPAVKEFLVVPIVQGLVVVAAGLHGLLFRRYLL